MEQRTLEELVNFQEKAVVQWVAANHHRAGACTHTLPEAKAMYLPVLYGLLMLKTVDRLSAKYVKSIKDGLFELRIEWQSNIYRIFFCFDEGQIVILFNGFQKKTQKTPDKEIDKALKLKKEYYERKRTKDV